MYLGKRQIKEFVQIPFNTFISQLRYKCLLRGIQLLSKKNHAHLKQVSWIVMIFPIYGKTDYEPKFSGKESIVDYTDKRWF